jgi:hypothetical protein
MMLPQSRHVTVWFMGFLILMMLSASTAAVWLFPGVSTQLTVTSRLNREEETEVIPFSCTDSAFSCGLNTSSSSTTAIAGGKCNGFVRVTRMVAFTFSVVATHAFVSVMDGLSNRSISSMHSGWVLQNFWVLPCSFYLVVNHSAVRNASFFSLTVDYVPLSNAASGANHTVEEFASLALAPDMPLNALCVDIKDFGAVPFPINALDGINWTSWRSEEDILELLRRKESSRPSEWLNGTRTTLLYGCPRRTDDALGTTLLPPRWSSVDATAIVATDLDADGFFPPGNSADCEWTVICPPGANAIRIVLNAGFGFSHREGDMIFSENASINASFVLHFRNPYRGVLGGGLLVVRCLQAPSGSRSMSRTVSLQTRAVSASPTAGTFDLGTSSSTASRRVSKVTATSDASRSILSASAAFSLPAQIPGPVGPCTSSSFCSFSGVKQNLTSSDTIIMSDNGTTMTGVVTSSLQIQWNASLCSASGSDGCLLRLPSCADPQAVMTVTAAEVVNNNTSPFFCPNTLLVTLYERLFVLVPATPCGNTSLNRSSGAAITLAGKSPLSIYFTTQGEFVKARGEMLLSCANPKNVTATVDAVSSFIFLGLGVGALAVAVVSCAFIVGPCLLLSRRAWLRRARKNQQQQQAQQILRPVTQPQVPIATLPLPAATAESNYLREQEGVDTWLQHADEIVAEFERRGPALLILEADGDNSEMFLL